ncbi:hypothetical protein ASD11_13255 [Aeromicrobium sp. Root495]|uniref:hypothetical protein n=1 Tax=Aeromicrobium sp. Root495 TaxID=1736550 RepID=UPI0006F8B340|nr:hypothetical protein [Aeromicrobium sp. Root495]KQY60411.1 hypothetical protein ASD11_13255 [Aeromicrobium sp. Root495]
MDQLHPYDQDDAVADRPIGTRSFVYGAKTLATSVVALLLALAVEDALAPTFWVLVSAGALGVAFSLIERSTTRGAEIVRHARVNLDVVGTVLLALLVNLVVHLAH